MKRTILLAAAFGMILTVSTFDRAEAQEPFAFSEVSFLEEEAGIGARAIGLGGAYYAAGNDYSSMYWNPAGLGMVSKTQFMLSLTHNKHSIDTGFLGTSTSNDQSKTAVGSFGLAYKVETVQGSLVFGFGYNRVHNYNSLFGYRGFNPGASYVGDIFSDPYIPDNLTQGETVEITGSLAQYSFGLSVEVAPDVYVGGTFNWWRGQNDWAQIFQESDPEQYWTVVPNDFDYYYRESEIDTDINGLDLKLGVMYKLSESVDLGATLNTPRYLTLTENWSLVDEIGFDNGDYIPYDPDGGEFEYKIRMPFVFGGGIAYSFPNGLVTAGFDYTDWTQLEFRDNFPLDIADDNGANRNIKQTLAGTFSPKFGLEYRLKNPGIALRGGFSMFPNPVEDADADTDRKYLSFGIGLPLGTEAMLDVAYRRGWWTKQSAGLTGVVVEEDHTDNRLFFTVSFNVNQ